MGVKVGLCYLGRNMRVFQGRTLRKIFGPKWDEVTLGVKKMHDEESCVVQVSLNIQAIKSSRMRWLEHVARVGERKGAYAVLLENSEGRRPR
jgi:hypothetical protein